MKRYLSIVALIVFGLSITACNRNPKGKAVCQCTLNGAPDGTYEFGSLTITDAVSKCNIIQYDNPADTCRASITD